MSLKSTALLGHMCTISGVLCMCMRVCAYMCVCTQEHQTVGVALIVSRPSHWTTQSRGEHHTLHLPRLCIHGCLVQIK